VATFTPSAPASADRVRRTSGRCARAMASASGPVAASATTTRSSSRRAARRAPPRNEVLVVGEQQPHDGARSRGDPPSCGSGTVVPAGSVAGHRPAQLRPPRSAAPYPTSPDPPRPSPARPPHSRRPLRRPAVSPTCLGRSSVPVTHCPRHPPGPVAPPLRPEWPASLGGSRPVGPRHPPALGRSPGLRPRPAWPPARAPVVSTVSTTCPSATRTTTAHRRSPCRSTFVSASRTTQPSADCTSAGRPTDSRFTSQAIPAALTRPVHRRVRLPRSASRYPVRHPAPPAATPARSAAPRYLPTASDRPRRPGCTASSLFSAITRGCAP